MEILKIKGAIIADSGSQVRFARKVKIQDTRLNRILNGWVKPRPEEVSKIRLVLGNVVHEVFQDR